MKIGVRGNQTLSDHLSSPVATENDAEEPAIESIARLDAVGQAYAQVQALSQVTFAEAATRSTSVLSPDDGSGSAAQGNPARFAQAVVDFLNMLVNQNTPFVQQRDLSKDKPPGT